MLVNIIQNTISSFRSALAAAGVITTNLKMWLGFETSETLGREEVVNGDFSNGTTGWSPFFNANLTIDNERLAITPTTSSSARATQGFATQVGKTYLINADFDNPNSSEVLIGLSPNSNGNGATFDTSTQSSGSINLLYIATTTTTYVSLSRFVSDTKTIYYDNISVKLLSQITPDKSGNNNVGELFTGKALEFDGSTTYVSANSFAGTLSTGDAFTFAIWFNSDKIPTDYFRNILISSGGPEQFTNIFKIGVNPQTSATGSANVGGIYFDDSAAAYNNVVPSSGGVNYNDGEWHRLVVSRPQGSGNQTLTFYVDGSSIGTAPCNPYWSNVNLFDFGQEWDGAGTSDHFGGMMSDIQVYDYAWTVNDITYDYANPNKLAIDNPSTSLVVTNLKGYWAMSEGAGSLAYDSANAIGVDVVTDGDFPLPNVNWTIGNGTEIIASGARVNNTVTGGIAFVKQFLSNSPLGKTFVLTYDVVDTNGNLLALQQATDLDLDTSTTGTNKKYIFTWNRTLDELTIKRKGGQTGVDVTIDNVSLQEISVGIINGATYEPNQPRIPQLGMQNWAKSTPVADEITLIPNPTIPTQDIFGNAVRDRLNSFNLDGSGYAEVADDASINPTTEITVQCWIQSNTEDDKGLVAKWASGAADYMLYKKTNTFRFLIGSQSGTSGTIPTTGWVNIAGTYDGTNIKTYINGNLSTTTSHTGSIPNNTNVLEVGRYEQSSSKCYSERISDVLLYDTALSATEIENNYNAGLSAHTN
tara:strand:+ start:394 stop:2664 length:2271 start_codon:yes stop_codon:yes gene_type:complete